MNPSSSNGSSSASSDSPQVRDMSYELADSIQMVVQTMLQVSPPQILDMTKEQFSACSLSVPASSMSAMFTVMKNINYLSANMGSYFGEFPPNGPASSRSAEKQPMQMSEENQMEFDIGEALQCVGDSLSGTAAQVGVDLVIYHGDVSLKHVNVVGDEAGLSYAISHVIRQILNIAERGDTLELGLLLVPVPLVDSEPTPSDDIPLQCTLRIGHRFAFPERQPNDPFGPEPEQVRQEPNFQSLLLRRILRQTNGSLIGDLPPSENYASGRTVELSFPLRRPRSMLSTPFDESALPEEPQYHHDPTLRQLVLFAETLKGKKATLYASPEACFAQHLTSYLTAWGMEVIHVSPDGNIDGAPGNDPMSPPMEGVEAAVPPTATPPDPIFVLIDDDVDVLRERLLAQRSEHNAMAASQAVRKRPPLASLHRPRSTVNIPTAPNPTAPKPSSVVIIHFTSLSNYKHLKDLVQTIMAGYFAATIPLPEVMILPKPAGPRRFLTALHTAATKPSVELPFLPIATSPATPASNHSGSFFSPLSGHEPALPKIVSTPPPPSQPVSPKQGLRPTGARSNSDRSVVSNPASEGATVLPPITPSPLSLPDSAEYFADAANKLGSTPSSGMVVQSPDGQPAGILFRPRIRGSSRAGSGDIKGHSGAPVPVARKTSGPRPSENGAASFSTLYANSAATSPSIHKRSPLSAHAEPVDGLAAAATLAKGGAGASKKEKVPSPIVSPKIVETTKPVSPSSPPGRTDGPAALRRRHQRKGTQEKELGPGGLKKGKPGDDLIPPISVLVVDDNPINQTILTTFMKRKKIKYDIANNGAEAVNKWKSGGFHLILMDIQMPVMDGIQATKEIRKMEKANAMAGFPPLTPTGEGASTPSESTSEGRGMPSPYRSSVIIVALTASSLQSDRDAALAAGCNDFLTKPVSLLWLNNKIIEWGSIKALQVWADIRPDVTRMNAGQAIQAKAVADRLQVPRGKKSPSPTARRPSGLNKEEGAAALALASPAVSLKNPTANGLASPTAERFSAPPISSRGPSSQSPESSPERLANAELPSIAKKDVSGSTLNEVSGENPVAPVGAPPVEEAEVLLNNDKSDASQDAGIDDQEPKQPDQEKAVTLPVAEDQDMPDPKSELEDDDDEPTLQPGIPTLEIQDATPNEPPPPLGMDRDQ